MAAAVTASVTSLPESRVRVEAEVAPEEVQRRLEAAAKAVGREMRIPGFRKGKVPPAVVIGRVGRPAILDEAVRESLGRWYLEAIAESGVVPVGDPDLDVSDLPGEGEPLRFSIEIGVRPEAKLGDYKGLEVGRRETQVDEEAIDGTVEQMRERHARLETHEGAAETGDFVVLDVSGTIDGETAEALDGRDQLVELGSGTLAEGMEDALVGKAAGDETEHELPFGEDHPNEELRGKTAQIKTVVKEVKRKALPELDDDFAADAAGFDTLDELRADVRRRLEEADEGQIENEFREAAVDAAVANAKVDLPDALVEARAGEMWAQLGNVLARQGIGQEQYLQISGKTEEDMIAEAKPEAEQALRREAVLAAVVEAEAIEPAEDELVEALAHSAEHEKTTPEKLLARLRKAGREEALVRDLATRKAVDLLAESAKPIDAGRAEAREKIWTPGD
ncbi:MAG: trigger factor [Pseudonocardiales bacterium]|nr:trigger factor [Pseudonocardiales bacterium]